jgi:hypothetical protein
MMQSPDLGERDDLSEASVLDRSPFRRRTRVQTLECWGVFEAKTG